MFVQTSYAPDEYWQSLEVAHDMTFGYGYLTWEWKHGLRSYFHPFIFYVLYKGLHTFSLDFPLVIIIIPKVFQALLTAASDWYFFLLCKNFRLQNYWIKVAVFTNWFWYYCGSRTLINTFETCLTIVALYYYPWNILMKKLKKNKNDINCVTVQKNSLKYLILASINCLVRPTAAIIWGPLVLLQLFFSNSKDVTKFIFKCILPALVLTLPIFIIIDYIWYGKFCIPAYNFIVFNTFKGISSFYGTNSFHWYFTQGLPVVLGLKSFPFVLGLLSFCRFNMSYKVFFK